MSAVINSEQLTTFNKEKIMKKSYFTVVLALTGLLGSSASSRAQDTGRVVVNVPFEFVAGGETFPMGTYNVSRVSPETNRGLFIGSHDKGAFVLPIVFEGVPAEHVGVGFEHVGDKYFLSKIETPAGVYTIAIPPATTKLARVKDDSILSYSGTN
jgi:hypothetical protein